MKKLVNIFAIVFFLAPVFASAASYHYTCADFTTQVGGTVCTGSTLTFDGSGTGAVLVSATPPFVMNVGTTYYFNATVVTSGGQANVMINNSGTCSTNLLFGSNQIETPMLNDGIGTDGGLAMADSGTGICTASGSATGQPIAISNICMDDDGTSCSAPPPPSPPSGIDAAVGVATSSFAATFGFDMDQVSSWMWDNLGQPILGSGIGVLYVMRFYWLGFIAISIIVLFAFSYFRFFRK